MTHRLSDRYEIVDTLQDARERLVLRLRGKTGTGDSTRVLKLVRPGASDDARTSIGEEYLLLQRLRHPHLVRVHEFVTLPDGARGYLMEDLRGPEPGGVQSIGWHPRDMEAVRCLMGALAILHSVGYAHLDLKPSQVRADGAGRVRLTDLGLAAPFGASIEVRGTWGSIAPEILRGDPWDGRVDLYGMGSLITQVWTGAHPMGDGEVGEQLRRALARPRLRLRERVEGMPEGLDRLIEGLLEPDPAHRPQDVRAAWRGLHPLTGNRERYMERQNLPMPDAIPWVSPAGVEDQWREAVRGLAHGVAAVWSIVGSIGSGRRRMLDRLRALAEVEGALCRRMESGFAIVGAGGRELRCVISEGNGASHRIALGASGDEQARCALNAYGLAPEGLEPEWTRGLLQLRIQERIGSLEGQRGCRRTRRGWAAAMGADLRDESLRDGALALVAESEADTPQADEAHPLVVGGWFRAEEGRLRAASPPWRADELEVLVGAERLRAAHLELSRCGSDVGRIGLVRHALVAGDVSTVRTHGLLAASELRDRGDVTGSIELLFEAKTILGSDFPRDWLSTMAEWTLHEGASDLYLRMLRELSEDDPWAKLIRARLALRQRQYSTALALSDEVAKIHQTPALAAGSLMIQASAYSALRDKDRAYDIVRRLVETARRLPLREQPWAYAHALSTELDLGAGGTEFEELLQTCTTIMSSSAGIARRRLTSALGDAAFNQGRFEDARRLYALLIEEVRKFEHPLRIADAHQKMAGVLFEEGMLGASRQINQEALSLYEGIQVTTERAHVQGNLAAIEIAAGHWSRAIDLSASARALRPDQMGRVVFTLGLEFCALVRSGMYQSAAGLLEELQDPRYCQVTWGDRIGFCRETGNFYRRVGDMRQSSARYRESHELFRKHRVDDEATRCACDWLRAELAWNATQATDLHETLVKVPENVRKTGELYTTYAFTMAAWDAIHGSDDGLRLAMDHLERATFTSASSGTLPWTWLCRAAQASISLRLGNPGESLSLVDQARSALVELVEAIGNEALRESYITSPDPRAFLAWCEGGSGVWQELPPGSSDLEVFLRDRV